MELWNRYPEARTDSREDMLIKLRLLTEDVAEVPVDILRVAVRNAARICNFMPLTSELFNFIRDEVEARKARCIGGLNADNDEKVRDWNRANAAKGVSIRWTYQRQSFVPGGLGEYRACDDTTGQVITPRFENREYRVNLQDVNAVRASYRAQNIYECTSEGVCRHIKKS
jgi:hypothetical protein